MKKNKIWILIALLLAAITVYFIFQTKNSTLSPELTDFAIEDTSSIVKIFIAEADGRTVTLTRQPDNTWLINNKRRARQDAIDIILETAKKITVKYPVPESARENTIKLLAGRSTKVEFYTAGSKKPIKVYYVGNATKDLSGTYMLLEKNGKKSSTPFVMHIPGFHGFLNTRFFADTALWQHRAIFTLEPAEIEEIKVLTQDTSESFIIKKTNDGFALLDIKGKPVPGIDNELIRQYIDRFKSIYFEQVDNISPKSRIDSVLSTKPFYVISVTDTSGKTTKVETYRMPNFKNKIDEEGNPYPYDVDRMYARVFYSEGFVDFVYVQYVTFDLIQLKKSDFIEHSKRKNNV